ncbi:hypothetical protein cyc_05555 [Cyclospora cayetanensis]|uniref:Uncharacterized protein n=1 Tax=Cyclospora cayetanensis TaxID=88456 RepID=A0A1D3D3Z7_9EIME|nr:hypothetical protein cyc_05555 [Cyclospora cayetanensis]
METPISVSGQRHGRSPAPQPSPDHAHVCHFLLDRLEAIYRTDRYRFYVLYNAAWLELQHVMHVLESVREPCFHYRERTFANLHYSVHTGDQALRNFYMSVMMEMDTNMRRRREAQRRLEYLLRLVNEMNTRNEAIETQYVALTDELHSTGLREASLDTGTAERLDKRLQDIRQLARAKVHEQEDTSFEIGAVSRMETEATWQLVPTTLDLHIDVLPVRNHNAALWTLTNCTSNNSSTRSGNTDSDEYIEEDLDVLSQVSDNANLDKPEATKALDRSYSAKSSTSSGYVRLFRPWACKARVIVSPILVENDFATNDERKQ